MYCSNCGTQNPDEAAFCSNCGSATQTTATIESQPTPQTYPGALTQRQLASRWLRLAAKIVDVLALAAAFIVVSIGSAISSVGTILFLAIPAFLVMQAVWLSNDGQTLGKRIVGIKIVSTKTGENLGFVPNVVLRAWLPTILGIIPFFQLIDILLIFREDKRCIHDLIAGTSVINA